MKNLFDISKAEFGYYYNYKGLKKEDNGISDGKFDSARPSQTGL